MPENQLSEFTSWPKPSSEKLTQSFSTKRVNVQFVVTYQTGHKHMAGSNHYHLPVALSVHSSKGNHSPKCMEQHEAQREESYNIININAIKTIQYPLGA